MISIAHLVGFACKLRNLGISDHGLIRELSVPLAGSLYSGSGHSALHDELEIYEYVLDRPFTNPSFADSNKPGSLAITHTLETTNVGQVPCHVQKYAGISNSNRRSILEFYPPTTLRVTSGYDLRSFPWRALLLHLLTLGHASLSPPMDNEGFARGGLCKLRVPLWTFPASRVTREEAS